MTSPTFAPLPPVYSLLLNSIQHGLNTFNSSGDAARSLLDNLTQQEFDKTLSQNIAAFKTAATGVMASQRVIVYARLLEDALNDWRLHGFDHQQEAP